MVYVVLVLFLLFIIYKAYATKQMPAKKEVVSKVQSLISSSEIFVAAKTFCPYCNATLNTFKTLGVKPTVLQLNEVPDGSDIQDALREITGQNTVPNIFIGGKHIGGNSDLQSLKSTGELEKLLKL